MFILVAYLGLLDEPRTRSASLRKRYRGTVRRTSSAIAAPLKNSGHADNNDISKQMQEEQFSLNKVPEVDVDELSVIHNQLEQV